MTQAKIIYTPFSVGHIEVSNRFVLAPMSRASAADDGTPTQNMAHYYTKFARGGFGLLIAEGAFTDGKYAQSYANQPGMVTDKHEKSWKPLVDAVHAEGAKLVLQLIHAGAVSQWVHQAYAPSAVRPKGQMLQGYGPKQGEYEMPLAMTLQDIKEVQAGFVQAAKRAENAGFDGVEIHCCNGYLLDQFLTTETNMRADQYGGTIENRLRLTTEIIESVQQATTSHFIVGARLSQAKATEPDYFWPGGLDDAKVIFGGIAKAGANYIHLASEAKGYEYHCATKNGENLTAFAKQLTGLPVIANGGLNNLSLANELISQHKADLIAIGKAALLNPELPKLNFSGKEQQEFTYEIFKYGVSIEAQDKWQQRS